MADMLVLSWDRRRLSGIEISPGGATPRIHRGFAVEWPEQPPTAAWLKDILRRHGISVRQVALALPREDVLLRLLELPEVADEEMPTLVRFQAAARSAQALEQLLLDYLPLPVREGVPQKDVWLATTLLTTVEPIQKLLQEAGLDLVQLTISSLCLTELIVQGETRKSLNPAGATLVVLRDGPRMELVVVSQRQLIAAHSVKWSSEADVPPVNKMVAEVSRLLVQVQAWLPEGTLQRACIIGEDADVGELPAAIEQRWNCSVERFQPLTSSGISIGSAKLEGPATNYAIAVGLAQIQSGALTPKVDLLHPRQPPAKRDPRKPLYAAAAAAALVLLAFATATYQMSLAGYESEIARLSAEERKLDQGLKVGDPIFVASKAVQDWQSRNVQQLKEFAELHELMSGTERKVISEYKFNVTAGNTLARFGLIGNARERTDAEQLAQNLSDSPKYKVRPTAPTNNQRDSAYASHFDLEVDLIPVSASAAAKSAQGAAATKNPIKTDSK